MRRVCAWCLEVTEEGPEPTSHGICAECAKRERDKWKPDQEMEE